jgi:hypothetical protein
MKVRMVEGGVGMEKTVEDKKLRVEEDKLLTHLTLR